MGFHRGHHLTNRRYEQKISEEIPFCYWFTLRCTGCTIARTLRAALGSTHDSKFDASSVTFRVLPSIERRKKG